MAGIAGILSLTRQVADIAAVERMAVLMAHRGPDDEGLYRAPGDKLVMACRRLAVIDPGEDAAMPMPNETGDLWLSFNGEIYNFRALRHSLELDGHLFRSASDSEVIVHAYERFGLDFLEHLHGMFALALWDDRTGRLVLARDRLGKKPLYYRQDGEMLAFASEIKALHGGLGLATRPDPAALSEYLSFGQIVAPRTLFEGIRKLGPGQLLVAEGGRVHVQSWWRPCADARRGAAIHALPVERHLINLRAALESSVADRLVSDVPFGAFLSGGLDSAAITAIMCRLMGRGVDAVTVTYPDAPVGDEPELARQVARKTGARHHELPLSARQVAAALPAIARALDEPLAAPVALPVWIAAKFFRDNGVAVALGGEGADEVLLGRATHLRLRRLAPAWWLYRWLPSRLRRPGTALMARLTALFGSPATARLVAALAEDAATTLAAELLFADADKAALMGPAVRDAASQWPARLVAEKVRAELPPWMAGDALATLAWSEVRMRVAERTLMALDKAAMAHSVEVRSPFLDDQFVDYVLAVPGEMRADGGQPKALLRRAVAELLPEAVLRAPEQTATPLDPWFRAELGARLDERLRGGRLIADGMLDAATARRLLDEHRSGQASHGERLWAILLLAEWYQCFAEGGQPALRTDAQAAE